MMTGHRRTRGAGGELEPTKREARAARRREALAGRWGSARSAGDRLVVAARYVHNALLHPHPPALDADADRLAQDLVRLGDRALNPEGRHAA